MLAVHVEDGVCWCCLSEVDHLEKGIDWNGRPIVVHLSFAEIANVFALIGVFSFRVHYVSTAVSTLEMLPVGCVLDAATDHDTRVHPIAGCSVAEVEMIGIGFGDRH